MRSNMDIQFVLDAYSCISYVIDYINKSSRGLSRLLRLAVDDANKGNKTIVEQMKNLAHLLYTCSEISTQEAAQCRLRIPMSVTSRVVEFIHSGPQESRQKMLKSPTELKKLPVNSTDIYKKGMIDRYAIRCDEHENLCLAEFIANYTFCNNNGKILEETEDPEEQQPVDDVIDESIQNDEADTTENSGTQKLKSFALKDGSGMMRERRKSKVIRYCRFSYHKDPANYFREMLLLFLPWRDEQTEIELVDWEIAYKNNEELIKSNYRKFNHSDIDFDLIASEIENGREHQENEEHSENQVNPEDPPFVNVYEFDENLVQPNVLEEMGIEGGAPQRSNFEKYKLPDMYSDEDYFKLMDKMNEEQRDIVLDISSRVKNNELIYVFITGGAGTGKSETIKALYQTLMRQYKLQPNQNVDPEIIICSYTGMASHNVDGTTAHQAFKLRAGKGTNEYVELDSSELNTFRCRMANVKGLIIDEISMLSSKYLEHISRRLQKGCDPTKEFGGKFVIVVGDFNQLKPVGGTLAFQLHNTNSVASLGGEINAQWKLFNIFRLNQIMRQKDDKKFAEALNRLAAGKWTTADLALWKSRIYKEKDLPEYAQNACRLYKTNAAVAEFNHKIVTKKKLTAQQQIVSVAEDKFSGNPPRLLVTQGKHALKSLTHQDTQGLPLNLELVSNVSIELKNLKKIINLINFFISQIRSAT